MRIVKQTGKQTGFTLVEIVLSLGLTALLLGLLSSGVYIVADDWNRNSDVLDKSLDQALAVLQVDRALHGAFPHSYTNFDTLGREIYFHGEDDYLSFVSAVSPQRPRQAGARPRPLWRFQGCYLAMTTRSPSSFRATGEDA